MDHQHFEEYLLNDTPVSREEKSAFQAHLKVCSTCAALAEVNRSLNHVVMAAPAAGFATRFQARLAARRKAERRRYIIGGLILLFSAVGTGLWFVLPLLPAAISSPTSLIVSWAQTLVSGISFIRAFVESVNVITRVAVGFVPLEAWVSILGLLSLLSLGGLISVQKTALPQAV